jgi:putative DNA primase/helicase
MDCKSVRPKPLAEHYLHLKYPNDTLVRYAGEFWAYNGKCYVQVPEERLIGDINASMSEWYYEDKDGKRVSMRQRMTSGLIKDVIGLLSTPATMIPENESMPYWRGNGEDLPAYEMVSLQNGLLHVPTRRLYPHSADLFIATCLPFAYDRNAPSPEVWIEDFLMKSLPGDDRSDACNLLAEWFGYCLTSDMRFQKMLCLIGKSRSGKGVATRTLTKLLGAENVCTPSVDELSKDFGLSGFLGKRLAAVTDAVFSLQQSSQFVAKLLAITGNDSMNVNRKHRAILTGCRLNTKIMLASNEVPNLKDPAGALTARMLFIDFPISFVGSEDLGLEERIATELPGIFNWALDGYDRLYAQGRFTASKSKALESFRRESDPVGKFIEERCILNDTSRVPTQRLFDAWCHWCQENGGEYPQSEGWFGKALKAGARYIERKRVAKEDETGKRPCFYAGIALNPSQVVTA